MDTSITSSIVRPLALGLGIGAGIFGASSAIGSAQATNPCGPTAWNTFDNTYNAVSAWQPSWDTGNYDRNHILIGTVAGYTPARLNLNTAGGNNLTVDLKEGTVIRPTGATPSAGQQVAVFGYWSNGTFIANRVVLHG